VKISDYELNPASFACEAKWFNMEDVSELAFDHNKILNTCFDKLQTSIRIKPIGFELLPPKFTLTELQLLYEAILDLKLDTRNFRKKILSMEFLRNTGDLQANVSHRPAKLFEFDEMRYNSIKEKGFSFEI